MESLKWFEDYKLIAVIRSSSPDDAESMIKAALAGGLRIFEISLQTPQAFRLLETYSKKEGALFGAGTITDGEMAHRAIGSGAKFLSSHYIDREVIAVAKNSDIFLIQGVSTLTEAMEAFQLGVELIRIYPAEHLGGPSYIRFLKGPSPFLKFAADGGVDIENAAEYLKHCTAVCLRNALFEKSLVRANKWSEITEKAKQFTQKFESLKLAK